MSLWEKTKTIAGTYTGTFIVVILLNQLLFFGFCLNPICLIAAMPHCLAITAFVGSWLNNEGGWGGGADNSSTPPSENSSPTQKKDTLESVLRQQKLEEQESRASSIARRDEAIKRAQEELAHKPRPLPEHKPQQLTGTVSVGDRSRAKKSIESAAEALRAETRVHIELAEVESKLLEQETARQELREASDLYFKEYSASIDKSSNVGIAPLELTEGKLDVTALKRRHLSHIQNKHLETISASSINGRENSAQKRAPVDGRFPMASAEHFSTTQIGKLYGVTARPDFFDHLQRIKLLTQVNGRYKVTRAGQRLGGTYRVNEKGETWVVWNEAVFKSVVIQYKKLLLDKMPFGALLHITHIDNLESILETGLLAHNNQHRRIDISDKVVNSRRKRKEPIYNHKIHEYVPFFFNATNPMLYRVQQKYGEGIVILSLRREIALLPKTIFSFGNAALDNAVFANDLNQVSQFNWDSIFRKEWIHNGIKNLDQVREMMSECLVHHKVGVEYIAEVHCLGPRVGSSVESICRKRGRNIRVRADSAVFF
jgi:hypothetical protein